MNLPPKILACILQLRRQYRLRPVILKRFVNESYKSFVKTYLAGSSIIGPLSVVLDELKTA